MHLKAPGDHLSSTERMLATLWEMPKEYGDLFNHAYKVVDTLREIPK
jgi:hypothetical protein